MLITDGSMTTILVFIVEQWRAFSVFKKKKQQIHETSRIEKKPDRKGAESNAWMRQRLGIHGCGIPSFRGECFLPGRKLHQTLETHVPKGHLGAKKDGGWVPLGKGIPRKGGRGRIKVLDIYFSFTFFYYRFRQAIFFGSGIPSRKKKARTTRGSC